MSTDVPVIRRDDASAEFFDGAARDELLIRRCTSCGRTHAPAVAACPDCGGTGLDWITAAGTASLVTWAVPYDRASGAPALVFALVELAEGPWMHTRVDAGPAALHAGQPLTARFVHPEDGESFPRIRSGLKETAVRTPITEMFGIEFPLVAFSHCRDVVAAVTNAGGMGVLGAVAHAPESLEHELAWIDDQVGGRPYGVDVLVPGKISDVAGKDDIASYIPEEHRVFLTDLLARYGVEPGDQAPRGARGSGRRVTKEGATELIDVSLAHPISLIASALGPPPPEMVTAARTKGVPVAALVGTVEHARRQVAAGADVIIAQGGEAGGHTGEISTLVLVPEVVDAVAPLPVLAAGGIATGRQMAAALALGAAGVWCGSVWLTTEEAETPSVVKEKMLAATSRDTIRSRSRTGKPARQLASAWTTEWEGPDSPGALPMPLQMVLAEGAMRRITQASEAGVPGAKELANYFVGQCVGQMNAIKPAKQVVYDIMEQFGDALTRLETITKD